MHQRQPNKTQRYEVVIGDVVLKGAPKKLIEDLDSMGAEAFAEGDFPKAHTFWQRSEFFRKEFDISRNS